MFDWIDKIQEVDNNSLNNLQTKVLKELRNNPNVIKKQKIKYSELGKISIDNIIFTLKKIG